MTSIQSKQVHVGKPVKEVFDFLSDLNNFELIMPAEKIRNWTSDNNQFHFEIIGISSIGMRLESKLPNTLVRLYAEGKNPFVFTLDVNLSEKDTQSSFCQMHFKGEINPFLKMVVEKPLENFFNQLVDNLSKVSFNQ